MYKKTFHQRIIVFFLFSFGIFIFFPLFISFAQNPVAGENNNTIQIKAENGLLSVKLENAPIPQVLQEIARQTGVRFEGWEKLDGRVTEQFERLPLDEGLRRISQNFVIILKKTGEEGRPLQVEKVIVIAQNDTPSSNSKLPEKAQVSPLSSPPAPTQTPAPVAPAKVVERPVPAPAPATLAAGSDENKSTHKTSPPPRVVESHQETEKEHTGSEPLPATSPDKPKPRVAKNRHKSKSRGKKNKEQEVSKTASLSTNSAGQTLGEEYFKQKRWDKAITCFARYLKQNPSAQEVREKLETAKQNAAQGISLYQQARKLEDEEDFEGAYKCYKKSCDIYPLLYDSWEKMRTIEQKVKNN